MFHPDSTSTLLSLVARDENKVARKFNKFKRFRIVD